MKKPFVPGRIGSYFRMEWKCIFIVSVMGMFYNIGLLAEPFFEGKLAQCLYDIFGGRKGFLDMLLLAAVYFLTIASVQTARYFKRNYVRRFANNTSRRMKRVLYRSLVHKPIQEMEKESVGSVMTKAISDVDDCVEGMRKFITEIFDTGVVILSYAGMLLYYDWRLALLCLIFPPISFVLAEKMKVVVQKTGAAYKESADRLSSATMDRAGNSITYRVYCCEKERNKTYGKVLREYESAAVCSQIWGNALLPLYHVISMLGVMIILYFGAQKMECHIWDIGIITSYLSCYSKLSIKSTKVAKLFVSIHKAEVSWKRIHSLMKEVPEEKNAENISCQTLTVEKLGVDSVFAGLSFCAGPGQVIGITGPVACGKTTLGKTFLHEAPYSGKIYFGKDELSGKGVVSYLGHSPELFSDSIENNVLLGRDGDVWEYLKAVELDEEVAAMPEGIHTRIGTGGLRLSGGQKQRLVLARVLAHPRPIMVLDDPFSAMDQETERKVYENLRRYTGNNIVLLISHRLYLFPELDGVIWMENGSAKAGNHGTWMKNSPLYKELYELQGLGGMAG